MMEARVVDLPLPVGPVHQHLPGQHGQLETTGGNPNSRRRDAVGDFNEIQPTPFLCIKKFADNGPSPDSWAESTSPFLENFDFVLRGDSYSMARRSSLVSTIVFDPLDFTADAQGGAGRLPGAGLRRSAHASV